jgi:hypothetical protein
MLACLWHRIFAGSGEHLSERNGFFIVERRADWSMSQRGEMLENV